MAHIESPRLGDWFKVEFILIRQAVRSNPN